MAYLTVTTAVDVVNAADGVLSLREAVAKANATAAADTIRFTAALEGATLTLTGGQLLVTQDLTIDGDGNGDGVGVTLAAGSRARVLDIAGTTTDVTLDAVTVAHGYAPQGEGGGGIRLGGGSLRLEGSTVRDNGSDSYVGGAGILAASGSRVTVEDSSITGNYTWHLGGGIRTESNVSVTIRRSDVSHNAAYYNGGAVYLGNAGDLTVEDSTIADNTASYAGGGAIAVIRSGSVEIARSSLHHNTAFAGGGALLVFAGRVAVTDSTIVRNKASSYGPASGGGIDVGDVTLTLSNSTVTGNIVGGLYDGGIGGGIAVGPAATLGLANSLVVGNRLSTEKGPGADPDISGTITLSNGHNVFGSKVAGSVPGDRQNVSPATVFAAIDPVTGGGQLSPKGIVPLKKALTNPALTAADPITAAGFGQLGSTPRPQPAGSLPDLGSIEIKQKLSTSPTVNNDVLTGNGAANNLAGLAGNDLIRGLGGADRLNGNDGSDVLDGGPGNDVLDGGTGMDIATFAGSTAVVVDLSAKPATAKRGSEKDRLVSIEGIIGSDKADSFKGDAADNEFQGGLGKDVATGGAGRDLYAFRVVQESPPGSGRDIIKDFVPGQDMIDVSNIDADETTPGRQSFRWVGKATLTGAAQLGYYYSGGNTMVRASTDADAKPELEIQLSGKKVLKPTDFRL